MRWVVIVLAGAVSAAAAVWAVAALDRLIGPSAVSDLPTGRLALVALIVAVTLGALLGVMAAAAALLGGGFAA